MDLEDGTEGKAMLEDLNKVAELPERSLEGLMA